MLNWKKLQDLNLKEVSIKTQIEVKFLEALVEKDFETLRRFNVKGFIKILNREYELDFDDFLEEYENYLNENNIQVLVKSKNNTITPKLDSYYPQKKFSFLPIIIIVVFIAIIAAGVYYFDSIKDFFNNEENNASVNSVTNMVNEAEFNLKNLKNDVSIVENEENTSPNTDEENIDEKNADETSADANTTQNDTENNTTSEMKIDEENQNLENITQNTEIAEENLSSAQKQVEFKANMKIWVGLIDLDTYRKTTSVEEGDFNISLDKDRLILTGAAALNVINEEGQEENFPAGTSKRFLIKDGKIKSITLAEFMKLNKGKEW